MKMWMGWVEMLRKSMMSMVGRWVELGKKKVRSEKGGNKYFIEETVDQPFRHSRREIRASGI
jgi:hypothetical protein